LVLAFNGANGLVNNNNGNHNGNTFGNGTGPLQLFGRSKNNGNSKLNGNGDDYKDLALDYEPFVSIHLPMYNEANVVDRLLTVCTSFDYENYEVIVADDSTDETVEHLKEWAKHPRVKVSHRENRSGFKGAALQRAVEEYMNPRAEFIMVFDADFVPPPDIIWQCLGYFYGVDGNNNHNHGNGNNWTANNNFNHDNNNNGSVKNKYVDDRVAVVQGYQWHMLNAGENWIAKGVRAEFSGSYVVERPGQEFFGSMKMISGSVYMMRTDVLRKLGWGTSITEDWEMTLKLYLDGYKVLYTPYIAAPAECISDFRRLSRQRMRWAEGHTYNVKKYFRRILACPHISWAEKLEFLYYTPYYLQAFFFCIGTVCWLMSEVILKQRLPYWTALWGWSLVFSNSLALVLMNLSGLFLENAVKKDIGGVLSALVLSNLLVPFQAYAALKGLLEKEEGGWFRTPKTGRITEVLDKFWLKKKLKQLLPRRKKRTHHAPDVAEARAERSFLRLIMKPLPQRQRPSYGTTLVVLLAAIITALLAMATMRPSIVLAGPKPYITLDPSSGYPGDSFCVEGDNFTPSTTVDIYWDFKGPGQPGTLLGSAEVGEDGTFTACFNVPLGASLSDHDVGAMSQAWPHPNDKASATFTVVPERALLFLLLAPAIPLWARRRRRNAR
jgi:cellulose synthase/poly-beta-1,6-N-acetylglucosamine synthase-like glycosyltransferase